jgi:hypothetical protein
VLIGAFDVLTVLIAYDALDLGAGGPGLLSALLGTGALISAAVTTVVVRRARLAPAVVVAIGTAGVCCLLLGTLTDTVTAFVVLPLVGAGAAMIDGLGRMLVQRSVDPRALASVFAAIELVAGFGGPQSRSCWCWSGAPTRHCSVWQRSSLWSWPARAVRCGGPTPRRTSRWSR